MGYKKYRIKNKITVSEAGSVQSESESDNATRKHMTSPKE